MNEYPQSSPRGLRIAEVMARTGLARSTIYWMAKRRVFPSPAKLSPRVAIWMADEIDQFLLDRSSNRTYPATAADQ